MRTLFAHRNVQVTLPEDDGKRRSSCLSSSVSSAVSSRESGCCCDSISHSGMQSAVMVDEGAPTGGTRRISSHQSEAEAAEGSIRDLLIMVTGLGDACCRAA